MSGKMERIPILSLSGCRSLTDILAELPIPKSSHRTVDCRTLLYEPKLVRDAYRCINTEDSTLVQHLRSALNCVSVDHISFKDISVESGDGSKAVSPPSLLCALEKTGAFSCQPATDPLPGSDILPQLSKDPTELQVNHDPVVSVGTDSENPVSLRDPLTACVDKSSESYSAVHIAPLRIALKKCLGSKDSPSRRGRKPRRKREVSETTSNLLGENQACQSHLTPQENVRPENIQVSVPALIVPTSETPTSCPADVKSLQSVANSESISQSVTDLQKPTQNNTPLECISADEKQTDTLLSVSTIDQSENTCALPISDPPKPPDDCLTPEDSLDVVCVPSVPLSTVPVATTVTHSADQPVTSAIASSTTASPASSAPHSVNPDNTSSRRVPDPALSQIFHSAALFHTYQPHLESEKSGSCTGGGLFDDWVDTSSKTTDSSTLYPVNDLIYSGSLSGPSSVVNVPSNCSQAPHSVGASADASVCAPRTPLSVPSNHSSYPATPGSGLPTVALSVNTAVSAISASPSTLPKCIYPPAGVHSPSVRLFNTSETGVEPREPTVEEQSRIAPLGLAAYLPRPGGLRQSFPDAEEGGLLSGIRETHSPRTALSPDGVVPLSCGTNDFGSKPSSASKQGKSLSLTNTSPTKLSGRGRFSSGKPRGGGGRRRRTELEELKMWSVNDRAQVLNDKKDGNTPESVDVMSNELKETINASSSHLSNGAPVVACKIGDQLSNPQPVVSDSSHGGFTEALVERVKRRRQQREMELSQRRSGAADRHAYRSSDTSPVSTPSPVRSVGPSGDSNSKTKIHDLNRHKNGRLTGGHRTTDSTDLTRRSHTKQLRQKSSDSDASLSPFSIIASSVPSSKPSSVSSFVDSVAPPPLDNAKLQSTYSTMIEHPAPLKSTITDSNESATHFQPDERSLSTVLTPKKQPASNSSFRHSTGKDQLHDGLSVESHLSSPSRTLFNDKASCPSSLSPNHRIHGPDEAFTNGVTRQHCTKLQSRRFDSHVHSPLVNKTDINIRRRRRVVISDDEEVVPSVCNKVSAYVHESPHLLQRRENLESQDVQSQLTKTSRPVESRPPVLLSLIDAPTETANSVDHRTVRMFYEASFSGHQLYGTWIFARITFCLLFVLRALCIQSSLQKTHVLRSVNFSV